MAVFTHPKRESTPATLQRSPSNKIGGKIYNYHHGRGTR